jgi:hypothetical protein
VVDRLRDRVAGGQVERLAEMAEAAADDDFALVRPYGAGEDAEQGGLARAVLADDPGPLARPDRQ